MKMSLASHGRGKIPLQMAVRDTTKWGLESSQAGPAEDLAVKGQHDYRQPNMVIIQSINCVY